MTDDLPLRAHRRGKDPHDTFQERLTAAGLGGDKPPDDADEFRNGLARSITMFINTWQGCPEPLCRRHRGCMAPNIHCTNDPPLPAKEPDHDWPKAKVEILNALQELRADHGEQE